MKRIIVSTSYSLLAQCDLGSLVCLCLEIYAVCLVVLLGMVVIYHQKMQAYVYCQCCFFQVGVILPPVLLQCTLCPTYGLTRILYHNINIIYITPY